MLNVGNFYGTPKPSLDSPLVLPAAPLAQSSTHALHSVASSASASCPAPAGGAYPSCEGKRRRNRSNVEAMAAKNNDEPDADCAVINVGGVGGGGSDSMHLNSNGGGAAMRAASVSIPSYREDGGGAMGGLSEAELGPLPQNWEKAYTERGEVYFIE